MSGDGIRVVHPLFQAEGDGAIPISPLQLEIAEIDVRLAQRLNEIWHSVLPETNHGNLVRNPVQISFGAFYMNRYYAAAIWTTPIAANRMKDGGSCLELRRFAIADDAPKNTGSRMLKIMRSLIRRKFPALIRLVSYQAVEHHNGTIYKAAGWLKSGESKAKTWHVGKARSAMQTTSDKIRWEISL